MESQNSQTVLKRNQAGNEEARAASKPIPILSIFQGHFSQVRHRTDSSAKFSSLRRRYSIPVRFLSPSGSVIALVSSSRLSDQINVTRPARYHLFPIPKTGNRGGVATQSQPEHVTRYPLLSYLSNLLFHLLVCNASVDAWTLATWQRRDYLRCGTCRFLRVLRWWGLSVHQPHANVATQIDGSWQLEQLVGAD